MEVKQGVERKLPCRLIDETDCTTPLTGIAWDATILEVWYQKEGMAALELALTVNNWTAIGDGNYDITFPGSILDTLKKFKYWIIFRPVAGNWALPFSNTISIVKYLPADIGDDINAIQTEVNKIQPDIIDVPGNYKDKNTEDEIKTAIDNYANKDTYKATGYATENPPSQNLDDYKADISGLLEITRRTLGLTQENFRLFDMQYDNNHYLISAIIKIYPTATDCENDTNEMAEYQLTASYQDGDLSSYKVKKS